MAPAMTTFCSSPCGLQGLRGLLSAALVSLASLAWADSTGITTVEVFANSAMHFKNTAAAGDFVYKVYRIDGLAQLEAQVNQGMPNTEPEARAYLQRNMVDIKKRYTAQAINAANGLTLVTRYKIDRIPAIVINQRAVVYGSTDIQQALASYARSAAAAPSPQLAPPPAAQP
jgi:integrating conjugative element protein (TIGR03757 family)